MSIEQMTTLLGWLSLINIALLSFSAVMIWIFKDLITRLHSQLFKLSSTELMPLYFHFLAHYKLLIIVFNVTPYLALKFMLSS